MPTTSTRDRQRVVVVTGGGGGIGAAIAEELGRTGAFVVTMDPLVSVDGSAPVSVPEETTAGRIVAAGGTARASSVSVTDRDGVRALLEGLVDERGGLDGVVNVAGITRPTSFASGEEQDWLEVLDVHLTGYLNVLHAALPIMASAGHGRILGVTSGSGWRAADTGAYGCAKRAVAALTWQLGRHAPPGVVVNAVSPIAATRMVTAALGRRGRGRDARPSATGGLSLASMPTPGQLGPLGAHLVGPDLSWFNGQVLFAGGSEVAVIGQPQLLEAVRGDPPCSAPAALDTLIRDALVPAEAAQVTTGGSNPRFAALFDPSATAPPPPPVRSMCAVVTDSEAVGQAISAAIEARGATPVVVEVDRSTGGFDDAGTVLASVAERNGPLDAVVVAMGAPAVTAPADGWERVLADHGDIVHQIHGDASWARAASDQAARTDRPLRLVLVIDATTAGGRTRAQAAAQLTRAAAKGTDGAVAAFAVGVETPGPEVPSPLAELAAHLSCSPAAEELSGAELVVGPGWFGLRSHPRPIGTITFGGPAVPSWLDAALDDIIAAPMHGPAPPRGSTVAGSP